MRAKAYHLFGDHIASVLLTFIVGNGLLAVALLSDSILTEALCSVGVLVCAIACGKASIDLYRDAHNFIQGWRR